MTSKPTNKLAIGAQKICWNCKNPNSLKALDVFLDEAYNKCMGNWIKRCEIGIGSEAYFDIKL